MRLTHIGMTEEEACFVTLKPKAKQYDTSSSDESSLASKSRLLPPPLIRRFLRAPLLGRFRHVPWAISLRLCRRRTGILLRRGAIFCLPVKMEPLKIELSQLDLIFLLFSFLMNTPQFRICRRPACRGRKGESNNIVQSYAQQLPLFLLGSHFRQDPRLISD